MNKNNLRGPGGPAKPTSFKPTPTGDAPVKVQVPVIPVSAAAIPPKVAKAASVKVNIAKAISIIKDARDVIEFQYLDGIVSIDDVNEETGYRIATVANGAEFETLFPYNNGNTKYSGLLVVVDGVYHLQDCVQLNQLLVDMSDLEFEGRILSLYKTLDSNPLVPTDVSYMLPINEKVTYLSIVNLRDIKNFMANCHINSDFTENLMNSITEIITKNVQSVNIDSIEIADADSKIIVIENLNEMDTLNRGYILCKYNLQSSTTTEVLQ